jgi:hypothetical protein
MGEAGGGRASAAAGETDDELDEDRAATAVRTVVAILGLPAASCRAAAS